MNEVFRVYFDPSEVAPPGHPNEGYPWAWFSASWMRTKLGGSPLIKDLVRDRDDHRCLRCKHPYSKGDGEWSRCDERCAHGGSLAAPMRVWTTEGWAPFYPQPGATAAAIHALGMFEDTAVEAQWKILTVHHLNGVKHDCRWWNLVSLCQRCHLLIQRRVIMERHYHGEHSEWFKPFAAGFYASEYLGEELTMEETIARLDEILAIEQKTDRMFPVE